MYLAAGVNTLLAFVESIFTKGQKGDVAESVAKLEGALPPFCMGSLIK
jgi:hypothetical protein